MRSFYSRAATRQSPTFIPPARQPHDRSPWKLAASHRSKRLFITNHLFFVHHGSPFRAKYAAQVQVTLRPRESFQAHNVGTQSECRASADGFSKDTRFQPISVSIFFLIKRFVMSTRHGNCYTNEFA